MAVVFISANSQALAAAADGNTDGWSRAGGSTAVQATSVNTTAATHQVTSTTDSAGPLKWRRPHTAPRRLPANPDARPLRQTLAASQVSAWTTAADGIRQAAATSAQADRFDAAAGRDGLSPDAAAEPGIFPSAQLEPAPATPGAQPLPATAQPPIPAAPPSLEDQLAQQVPWGQEDCPSQYDFKPIGTITNNIAADPGEFPRECPLGDETYVPRNWVVTTYTWKASGLCHKPLYFEEVALERYGHVSGPISQPLISGAHFFATPLILPYKMGLEPPDECIYPLGYYRPGSCAPFMCPPIPFSLRGAALEAGAVAGLIYLIP